MDVAAFDFALPPEAIALRPARPRDSARLLVVHVDGGLEHRLVSDLPDLLAAGDVLVVNDTRVLQARLNGRRLPRPGGSEPGPKIEVTLHRRLGSDRFRAFAKPARKLAAGDRLLLGRDIAATVLQCGHGGDIELGFELSGALLDASIAGQGGVPLPPYIAGRRKPDENDLTDYQTMFSRKPGSVAAPTAGLHFTPDLLARLSEAEIGWESLTLHVGAGTFLPVSAPDTDQHIMHLEEAWLEAETAARLNRVRAAGGRCVAVGSTSLRTLESAATLEGQLAPFAGGTDIFITPGYRFRAVDLLLTNFHLPRSTLFMLVCAFAGTDTMKRAYSEAITHGYRFYSYGDACLLWRAA